jgi:hypothetical protein
MGICLRKQIPCSLGKVYTFPGPHPVGRVPRPVCCVGHEAQNDNCIRLTAGATWLVHAPDL